MAEAPVDAIATLRSLHTVKSRCAAILVAARAGETKHFAVNDEAMGEVAKFVMKITNESYPDGNVPFHARSRHFEVGGVDRLAALKAKWTEAGVDAMEQGRRLIDLSVVSVLLDAGAGAAWRYVEESTGQTLSRSEGLAVASLDMFLAGAFSSTEEDPTRVDAPALLALTVDDVATAFQVTEENPLVGLEGRVALLQRLGGSLQSESKYFGEAARPGGLVDYLFAAAEESDDGSKSISVHVLWEAVMSGLADTWPATRTKVDGVAMGDVWPHSALPEDGVGGALVPFHKLSQWLTYSLMEPLAEAGLAVPDVDDMTALPEYRNGGLLVDMGWLQPKYDGIIDGDHEPSSEVIIEWRALTVALIAELADEVRRQLGKSAEEFPTVKLLEGGTWKAGRVLARERRPETGQPPIRIISDGTVF
eukprot:PLAT11827.1.p1 GENE.PLAT11827.1~~PLAT11827.1.p1  ORF type:complete len:439 (+),score=142.44 PLAT11827.1:59-1318(+)